MNFEMFVDGQSLVKIDLNFPLLARVIREAAKDHEGADARSTPATEAQMRDLLSRIDQRSVQFLKAIGASEEGSIAWTKMREIFHIEKEDDWAAYSGSFGKGITRAYRKILGDKAARLVWWIDADFEEHEWDSDMCSVYIDGPALSALRAATGN
jgi:hypothetical protein